MALLRLMVAPALVVFLATEVRAQHNPGLMNILEVQPSADLAIHGSAEEIPVHRDSLYSWLEGAMREADFGQAAWTFPREDSIAFLDVNVQIVPQDAGRLLTSAAFSVLRPGFVFNVPAQDAYYDVPVMQTAYALSGDAGYIEEQLESLIGQFVEVVAARIREHNPEE